MTHGEISAWARGTVWVAGCLTLGRAAELHVLVAIVLLAVWSHYVATTPTWRSGTLLLISLTAGWAIKQMIGGASY